ncbi:MAG: DUF169 domain-containing protein [Thermodesulfobacteriota bacterium]|nr:DUF169 domain-containing protein [Thermodesulfobacteriota bacterium]
MSMHSGRSGPKANNSTNREKFRHGEGYMKSPELLKRFIDSLPIMEVPEKYVVFKPLTDLDPTAQTNPAVL